MKEMVVLDIVRLSNQETVILLGEDAFPDGLPKGEDFIILDGDASAQRIRLSPPTVWPPIFPKVSPRANGSGGGRGKLVSTLDWMEHISDDNLRSGRVRLRRNIDQGSVKD